MYVRCAECGTRVAIDDMPFDDLHHRCPICRVLMRSDAAHILASCRAKIAKCDALTIVHASSLTYPAANFPMAARARGAWLIEIGRSETFVSANCDIVVRTEVQKAFPALVDCVRALKHAGSPEPGIPTG